MNRDRLRILAAAVLAWFAPKAAIAFATIALIVVLAPLHRIGGAVEHATEGARRLASAIRPSTAATEDQPMARTKQPTAKEAEAARMADLWRQYTTLERRSGTFLHWVILKRSCTTAEGRRYVRAFLDSNGGAFPADAPIEAN